MFSCSEERRGGKEARNFHNGGNKEKKRALRRRSSGMFCWLAGCFLFYGKTYNFEIHKTFSLTICRCFIKKST